MCSKADKDYATLEAYKHPTCDANSKLLSSPLLSLGLTMGPWQWYLMLRLRLGSQTCGLRCKLHVLYDPFYRCHGTKAGKGIEASDIAIAASCVLRSRSS
jgi:hypothetical protein